MKFYSIVTRHKTGEFNNYVQPAENKREAKKIFEYDFPGNQVIHIWEGATIPETYRSLKYIINIGFLARNEEANAFTDHIQIPFAYEVDIENGIVHFYAIEEENFHRLYRPSILDSLQSIADELLGEGIATFYLYHQNGAIVKNWHNILTHVEGKDKKFLQKI